MAHPVLEAGEKVHIITRRNFREDLRRHFAGIVTAVSGGQMRVEGHVFVFNEVSLEYRRRPELRVRLFGLLDNQIITNILPPETRLEALRYVMIDGRLVITDGAGFRLDVNEFGASS